MKLTRPLDGANMIILGTSEASDGAKMTVLEVSEASDV